MGRLWRYLRRYRLRYVVGIACLVGATSLAMAVPWLLGRSVHAIETDAPARVLLGYLGLIVAIALLQGVARTFSRFVIFNVGRDIEYDLRNELFAHLEKLPLAFYQQRHTGDLMSRLVNDVTAVRMLLGPGILNFINTPVAYVWGLALMLYMNVPLTLASLAVYPVALIIVKRTSRLLMERSLRVQEGLGDLSNRVQENLTGMHVVKAYAGEEHEIEVFTRVNERFQELSLRLARVRGFIIPVMSTVGGAGSLVVLWLGGHLAIAGRLSVGDLVAFLGYLAQLAWPTMALGWMLSILQRGRAAMQRLNEIFAVEPAIASPPGAVAPGTAAGEIALRGVTFRYPGRPDAPPILDDVDLTVPAGRTVALVGRTGAGKSSLVQLLPRLFDVDAGTVLLDGRDVRTLPLGWLRRQVGLVPQDPFLFSRTIRENVGLALDGDGDGHVDWAVRMAALSRDLASFPHGLGTVVGERGVTLSGGQKQRVALARVLAAAPRVLILDDALSSVDAETERTILDQLRDFFRERTTILVAHRITTVKEADLIFVIDDGRLVESGDHETLLARGGVYADLFRQQALEGELEAI
jgi:ATP-binding cassette, subfamily B, multidrug efflux pump